MIIDFDAAIEAQKEANKIKIPVPVIPLQVEVKNEDPKVVRLEKVDDTTFKVVWEFAETKSLPDLIWEKESLENSIKHIVDRIAKLESQIVSAGNLGVREVDEPLTTA